jgi:hypothetical protein
MKSGPVSGESGLYGTRLGGRRGVAIDPKATLPLIGFWAWVGAIFHWRSVDVGFGAGARDFERDGRGTLIEPSLYAYLCC